MRTPTFSLPYRSHFLAWLHFIALGFFSLTAIPASFAAVELLAEPSNPVFPRLFAPGSIVTLRPNTDSGPGALYQWFHDDVLIPGATASSLKLSNLSLADSGNYRLRITRGAAEYSETATVNVVSLPSSPVDKSFTTTLSSTQFTYAILAVASDGSTYVEAAATANSGSVIRLRSDGSTDTSFNFPFTFRSASILHVLKDGRLIVSSPPYRLNSDGSNATLTLPAGFDSSKPLTAAMEQPDGKVLVAQENHLARLNADDSIDPSFMYNSSLNLVTHTITGLQRDTTGRIYVSARQTDPDPLHFPQTSPVVIRLGATGAEDVGFSRQLPIYGIGTVEVYPLDDGRILRSHNYKGAKYWAILNADGSVSPTWGSASPNFSSPNFVIDPAGKLFFVDDFGLIHRYIISANTLQEDGSFYQGEYRHNAIVAAPDNKLLAIVQAPSSASYSMRVPIVRLRRDDTESSFPANATIRANGAPHQGSEYRIGASFSGALATFEWLALDGQPLPSGQPQNFLSFPKFTSANLGRYQLRLTGPGGVTVLSNVVDVQPSQESYLANLSARAFTGVGEDTAIVGFVTEVSSPLPMGLLIRGVGPSLQPFGIDTFLPNPALNIYNRQGVLIANNDQWWATAPTDITSYGGMVGAFSLKEQSNDAALLYQSGGGVATAHLISQTGAAQGAGLLEIYRVPDARVAGNLLNLSFRARTGSGEATAIAGFVITDPDQFNRPVRLLLRAVGPTLASNGITHPLANPLLTVFNNKGEVVAQNDDWAAANTSADAATLSATMKQVGAFELPANSKDAALLLDLPAGVYTMHATGGEGVVLMEIYLVR